MKMITFLGTSKDDLRAFPTEARQEAGWQLDRVQRGEEPTDWKPMPSVGAGVREIRIRDQTGAYRVIYVLATSEKLLVLHAFRKKAQQTPKKDLELAGKRLQHWRAAQ